jgi:glutathione S-transferase
MKLFYSATSPFVRKCLVVAHELGIVSRIELVPAAPHPVTRDASVVAQNPLGKIPTLVTADGAALYDSRVVCEYLDAVGGGRLFPRDGRARWDAQAHQSLGDGIMDAAILIRYETFARPEPLRWPEWIAGQTEKVTASLAGIERQAAQFGARVDIGTITLGCALGYLDMRMAHLAWRERYPATAAWFAAFADRPSMVATRPPG